MEHSLLIDKHRAELTKKISVKHNLTWERLQERKVITCEEVQSIKEKYPAERDQISEILDHLRRRPHKDWKAFKEVLKSTNQSHVLSLISLAEANQSDEDSLRTVKQEKELTARRETTRHVQDKSAEHSRNVDHVYYKEAIQKCTQGEVVATSIRQNEKLLDNDRKTLIKKNRKSIEELVSIQGEELLDILLRGGVIHGHNKVYIEKTEDEELQVGRLLNILLKKTNLDFDNFCKALYETKQIAVVQELLISDVDLKSSKQKLADYYEREFTEISLYSANEEKNRVPLPKLYVPMTWRTFSQGGYGKMENLTSYTDIWHKIEDSYTNKRRGRLIEDVLITTTVPVLQRIMPGMNKWHQTPIDSRIVIDGVPGAGKTTFVKRLCYIWAQALKNNIKEEIAADFAIEEKIIIPIILRLIKHENTLLDILVSQLPLLTISEICSIIRLMKTSPEDVVLLLDGYDELLRSECIGKLLTKERDPKVLCLTTSRPHAIETLKRLTAQTLDQHIKLQGFSHQQVKQYINQFFFYNFGESDRGESLISYLTDHRTALLHMAFVPIRCEMICIVWAHHGRLGKTIAELYTLFIIHLLDHMEEKYTPESKVHTEDQLLERYHPILMKIGKLANSWVNKRRLCIVFTTAQVKDCLGDDFNDAVRIGLITKSHPNSQLEQSQWSFPHLTLQEFMVAFYLGYVDEAVILEFVDMNKNLMVMQRFEVLFQFLCSKHPATANRVLSMIIRSKTDEKDCCQIFRFIAYILPYYGVSTVCLPVPRCLDLTMIDPQEKTEPKKVTAEKYLTCAKILLDMDRRDNMKNLRVLKISKISKMEPLLSHLLGQAYVTNVSLDFQDDLVGTVVGLKSMTSLVALELIFSEEYTNVKMQSILNTVPEKVLENLVISGYNIMALDFTKFVNLKKITVNEESHMKEELVVLFLFNVNQCPALTNLSCSVFDMYLPFISYDGKASLELKIKNDKTSEIMINTAGLLRQEDPPVNIHTLDMSGHSELDDMRALLGDLLNRLCRLQVLRLQRCDIYEGTLNEMLEQVHKTSVSLKLKELDLNYNMDLEKCGSPLGELISLMTDLQTLNLMACYLLHSELGAMADTLQATTNIQVLDLYRCNLRSTDEATLSGASSASSNQNTLSGATGGGLKLLQHMPHLQAIRVGESDSIPDVCAAVDAGYLSNLRILDIANTDLQPGRLQMLGQYLPMMNKLHALNLRSINRVKPKDYKHVYKNIPPTLQHLNVYSHHSITFEPYLILDYQQHLKHLKRLSGKFGYTDVENLQELLEQHNPDIQVYSDDMDEDIWNMYVTAMLE